MKLRLALLVAITILLFAPLSQAQSNCNAAIIDQTGTIHNPQIISSAARTLINQGADVHVVIVDSIQRYGSSLTDVERSFEQSCPNWVDSSTGRRKANLFVVMVAPNDRVKNIFLGSYYSGAFDIPSTYSQLSNSYFKNRQWELGLAAVLSGVTGRTVSYRIQQTQRPVQRDYAASGQQIQIPNNSTQNDNSGISGLAIFFIVLLVLGIIGAVCYFVFRKRRPDSSSTDSYGTDTVRDP